MNRKKKLTGLVVVFLLVLQTTAVASAGVAISPAKEEIRVNINGENKTFTIFNTGTREMKYVIDLGGNAAKFAELQQKYITIQPGSYEEIAIYIEPTTEYDENENYTLTVHPKFYIEGGIVSEAGVKATLSLNFHGERLEPFPEPKEETVNDEDEPRLDVSEPKEEEFPFNLFLVVIILLLLVSSLVVNYLFRKKVRKNENKS